MVTELLLTLYQTIIVAGLTPIVALPSFGTDITSIMATVVSFTQTGSMFLNMIYGHTLLLSMIAIVSGILLFDTAYKTLMWILAKIPFVNFH